MAKVKTKQFNFEMTTMHLLTTFWVIFIHIFTKQVLNMTKSCFSNLNLYLNWTKWSQQVGTS